jgi:cysteine-rich repeat protein
MALVARAAIGLLLVGACIHDSLEPCGDKLCPSTAVCRDNVCVPRDAIEACSAGVAGAECNTVLVSDGVCANGVCVERGCGNGVVELNEICDDGNESAADACASDCQALTSCPPPGMTPMLSDQFQQLSLRGCQHYTTTTDGTVAVTKCSTVMISDDGAPFQTIPAISAVSDYYPTISPSGDVIWFYHTNPAACARSRRTSTGWSNAVDVITANPTNVVPGRPSANPMPHLFVTVGVDQLTEYVFDAQDVPQPVKSYTAAELGVDRIVRNANLSNDGLRLVFGADVGMVSGAFYSDRPTIDGVMSRARRISETAPNYDPFLTDDCERLYFSALNSMFYLRQIGWR